MFVVNIILVLFLLSAMIIVHEFGHWITARALGFQTPIFGFGLPLGSYFKLGKWKDTEFRFHWFVLGGYVAIPELGDETNEEILKEIPDLKPLKTFPVWKRICVASSGVFFNILFAYLMCLIMVATLGPPSTKGNVVITNLLDSDKNAGAFNTKANPIAKKAGFEIGDVILKVNHRKVQDPSHVVKIVKASPLKEVTIKVERLYLDKDNKKKTKVFNIKVIPNEEGTIGVGLGILTSGEYEKPSKNPIIWFCQAALTLFEWTLSMLIGFGFMIMNLLGFSPRGTPRVNADDLHGIIAIVSVFAQALTIDPREIFRWTALINVNLAIINLLPIPALDGGHLLFMVIEKVRGKRLAEKIQQKAIQTGFFLLILLMCFVLFNDVKGLVTGKFDFMKRQSELKGTK